MISYPPTNTPQPSASSMAPATSAEAANASGRRYRVIFGSVFAALIVLALALAAIAPDLRPQASQSAAANWQPIYQGDLTAPTAEDVKAWDVTEGCAFYSVNTKGLDATSTSSGAAVCNFTPPGSGGATTQGFYLELGIAPAADVPVFQQALLLVGSSKGNTLAFEIGQDGSYLLCENECSTSSGDLHISGGTAAWHGDAFVANTIAVEVSPDHQQEIFYVNGQQVASASVDVGAQPALAVGAPTDSAVIFTHAKLSTGQ